MSVGELFWEGRREFLAPCRELFRFHVINVHSVVWEGEENG